jgi:predicted Rossmann fold nucleotide-binding protein DprA/Smf involved in DNA uptake
VKRKTQRNLAEVLRDGMYLQDRVATTLKDGPKTISELSQVLKYPPAEVTQWVMMMRRYGKIADLPKSRADDYYQYKLVEGK